jgi:nucleoside-diphosphate-sugar epimerase
MNCVISGITGLIGSRFYELYGDKFEKIYQLGRSRANLDAEWIEYDFSIGGPITLPDVDVFFHFAGQTSVYSARENILNDLNLNVVSLIEVLNALKNKDRKPFVVIAGTASEFGYTDSATPIDESTCSNPITFYDISKLAAEHYLLQYVREGWLDGCALRLANVYGGNREGQNSDRGVIDKVFQKALAGQTINIFGSGEFLRDYVHIDDVASAFYLAWLNREYVNGDYFNIGTGVGTTLKEAFYLMARLAEEVTGREVNVISVEPPDSLSKIEYRSYVSCIEKFVSTSGWKPIYDLESGIRYSYERLFN